MNNNPVDQWTNAELARWMAERDVTPEMAETWGGLDRAINAVLDHEGDPTDSLDAAVAWIERRGFIWEKRIRSFDGVEYAMVYMEVEVAEFAQWRGIECVITDTCPTARALCIAAVKAQMEVEAKQ